MKKIQSCSILLCIFCLATLAGCGGHKQPAQSIAPPAENSVTESAKESETNGEHSTNLPQTKPTSPHPTQPTDPPQTDPPKPTEPMKPAFKIDTWVAYAKSYAQNVGLTLDQGAVWCWDAPIVAGPSSKYLERDIQSRLNRYSRDEDITAVWVWAEPRADGNYELFIGYA